MKIINIIKSENLVKILNILFPEFYEMVYNIEKWNRDNLQNNIKIF